MDEAEPKAIRWPLCKKYTWLLVALLPAVGMPQATNYVVVTNTITAAPEFRVVNGKLYNSDKSILWKKVQGKVESADTNGTAMCVEMRSEVVAVDPGFRNQLGNTINRRVYTREVPARRFVVLRCSASGGERVDEVAMLVGATNISGQQMDVYDCGTLHRVTVVQTNRVIRR